MPDQPERVLPLQGATNFRDLGGYPGLGGRPVRWRQLFRSDHLGGLTDADRSRLASLRLARVIDFRGQAERAAEPYELPGVAQHQLAIEPTIVQRIVDLSARGEPITVALMRQLMLDLYRRLINHEADRFAQWFELLLHAEGPLVFHCTAGKDRTGVAAALLLLALGVSRELVMQDYLLTNDVFKRPIQPEGSIPMEAMRVLWRVQADYLDHALRTIDTEHGGIERYFSAQMRLGPAAVAALQDRYLSRSEPA